MASQEIITSNLSVEDINTTVNHEPRIMDLRLAEALGFKRPHDIRPLIERHQEALDRFGEVFRTVRKTSAKGGRPTSEAWLTKKQALYLCTKSETERATDVTIQMVDVFDEVMNRSRAITAAATNVVVLPTVDPEPRRRFPNTREAVEWRKQLKRAQHHLFMLGEFYPTVVRHKEAMTSPTGQTWPVDTTRETLKLPDGSLVIPIQGGGWQFEPAA